jgi:hypothetical protein
MMQYPLGRQPESTPPDKRVIRKKGRLTIDVPVSSFQTVFVNFNNASEAFAMSLTDRLNRLFAYQYLAYLQDIARGWDRLRPSASGRPNCRLITYELERLFRSYFFRPDQLMCQ